MSQNFYDHWLELTARSQDEKKQARKVINPDDLQWVQTRQDARAALLVAPESGFRTWGTTTMVAEIPEGWQTGRHSHGEEAIYILEGTGCSVIDGQRFDWEAGACLKIPFGAMHQHFNLGSGPVSYLSAMAPDLEYVCLLLDLQQHADRGPITDLPANLADSGDHDAKGQRIIVHAKDAPATSPSQWPADYEHNSFSDTMPHQMRTGAPSPNALRKTIHLMYPPHFPGGEVEMTSIFCYAAGDYSPKHAHMEAVLYVLEGGGYSIIDDERCDWVKGGAFHVQGPQTAHQFFATEPSKLLRVHFGIRSHFFQSVARGKFPYLFLGSEEERSLDG